MGVDIKWLEDPRCCSCLLIEQLHRCLFASMVFPPKVYQVQLPISFVDI